MALPYVEITNMDQDDLPRRRGVLFPIAPKSDESFFGFLFRTADWNSLNPAHILLEAGVPRPFKPSVANIALRIDEVAQSLCVPVRVLEQMLVGSREEGRGGTVAYFGMSLRFDHVASTSRRISPAALRNSAHHRAIWMLNPAPYCHETWDLLIDHCPNAGCGAPLTWWSPCAIDRCARCGGDLKEATSSKVATSCRPVLHLFAEILSPDPAKRSIALSAFPLPFGALTPEALFELILVFARAASDGALSRTYRDSLHLLAEGVRIALDFPRSFDSIAADGLKANRTTPAFFLRLGGAYVLDFDPEMRALLAGIVQSYEPTRHGPARLRALRERGGFLKLSEVAVELGVDNAAVSRLVQAGTISSTGVRGSQRRSAWFKPEHVAQVKQRLGERMSFSELSRRFSLPRRGIEQLVSLGLLALNDDPLVLAAHSEPQLHRAEALQLMEAVLSVAGKPETGVKVTTLPDAFTAIEGEKPWAAVIHAAIERRLPGGLLLDSGGALNFENLALDDVVAIELSCGLHPPLLHIPSRAASLGPERNLSRTEVERYLNCYPRDVSWLLQHGHLTVDPLGVRNEFSRSEVQRLAGELISSREISWRWRVSPALRDALPEHGIQRALGPFWPRPQVVQHFARHFPHGRPT